MGGGGSLLARVVGRGGRRYVVGLISGHASGRVCVWDVSNGERWRELEGHTRSALSLCVVGWRLASGLADTSIKVWAMGQGPEWPCERTLSGTRGYRDIVWELLVHGKRLFSASRDGSIRAWAVGTWAAVASVEAYDVGASEQWQ